jgi:hypothetical protein
MSAEAMNGRTDCGTQGIPLPAGYVRLPPPPPPPNPTLPNCRRPALHPPQRGGASAPPPSPDRFRGVRIFDISDIVESETGRRRPELPRLAHAFAAVDPKDKDNVYIYISGTGQVRQEEELAGCSAAIRNEESQYRALSHRHHQSSARPSGTGEDRKQPAHLHRQADRALLTASGKAATTAKARRPPAPPTSATTSPSTRRSVWPRAHVRATESCSIFPTP